MTGTILRSEAMKIIHSGVPFSAEIVTADRRRGTGGDLLTVKNWMKVNKENAIAGDIGINLGDTVRDPNHHLHKTVNIFNPANRKHHPTKLHFRLLVTFNGKRVLNG